MAKSTGAIVAGFVVTVSLAMAADEMVLRFVTDARDAFGRVTDVRILIVMLTYTGLSAIGGSYATGRLAPSRPLRHAMILGAIALALTVVATFMFWDSGPAWYHVIAVGMVLPSAWIGGAMAERRRAGTETRTAERTARSGQPV